MGFEGWKPTFKSAKITETYNKRHGRTEFVRVTCWEENGELYCKSTGNQSSAWQCSMAMANGLMKVEHNKAAVVKGEKVIVEIID